MKVVSRFGWILVPAVALGLATAGCDSKKEEPKPKVARRTGGGGEGDSKGGGAPAGSGELAASAFTGTIKGRVTYNGDAPATPVMKKPDKNTAECPGEVPTEGWYCQESSDKKGVKYAVVFIRAPQGMKMPKLPDNLAKAPDAVPTVGQPHCQFEPRVTVLHPKQNLLVKNDSQPPIGHDANIQNARNDIKQSLQPGNSKTYEIEPFDNEPCAITCNTHSSFMKGYVWKMTHPFLAVTDADGKFELKNLPITTNGKLQLCVWHEMIQGNKNIKVIQEIELKDGETKEINIAIPK